MNSLDPGAVLDGGKDASIERACVLLHGEDLLANLIGQSGVGQFVQVDQYVQRRPFDGR